MDKKFGQGPPPPHLDKIQKNGYFFRETFPNTTSQADSPATCWENHFTSALEELEQASTWQRPPPASDKLFMSIGGGDLIEVGHPTPRWEQQHIYMRKSNLSITPPTFRSGQEDPRLGGRPVLHLGPVAAGRGVALDDQLRQEFAYKNGVLAYDSELDSVVEVRSDIRQQQQLM